MKKEKWSSFQEIYLAHNQNVRTTVYWIVGEAYVDDVVQEVFVNVWRKQHLFQGRSTLKTWIYRISVNTALNFLKKNKRHQNKALWSETVSEPVSEMFSDPWLEQIILSGILALPEKIRTVFVLYYKQQLSVEEISETLNVPRGTVKSRLHHGREQFKEFLKLRGVSYE